MITTVVAAIALGLAGLALSLVEGVDSRGSRSRAVPVVAARVAQSALPLALLAAAIWGEHQDFAIALAAGWVVGALIGTLWAVVRSGTELPATGARGSE